MLKKLNRWAAFLSGLVLASTAIAQTFPTKPVTLMVPYPAGGLSDVIARTRQCAFGKSIRTARYR